MDDEVHIASFVAQHRPEAAEALAELARGWPGLEIAVPGPARSILLYECGGSRELIACMDAAQGVPGVISINLVYHHAQARAALEETLPQG